ncbi:MAG TPA: DoxX family protein [Propionibacteriaceae bacterium]
MTTKTVSPATVDVGLFVLRLALGGVMIAHGYQKLFVNGLAGTQQGFTGMGAPLPEVTGVLVVLLELGGGVAIILGLLTRVIALLFAATMAGALVLVHLPNGFYASDGGYELVALLGLVGIALALAGAGRFSVDRAFVGRRRAKREVRQDEKVPAAA